MIIATRSVFRSLLLTGIAALAGCTPFGALTAEDAAPGPFNLPNSDALVDAPSQPIDPPRAGETLAEFVQRVNESATVRSDSLDNPVAYIGGGTNSPPSLGDPRQALATGTLPSVDDPPETPPPPRDPIPDGTPVPRGPDGDDVGRMYSGVLNAQVSETLAGYGGNSGTRETAVFVHLDDAFQLDLYTLPGFVLLPNAYVTVAAPGAQQQLHAVLPRGWWTIDLTVQRAVPLEGSMDVEVAFSISWIQGALEFHGSGTHTTHIHGIGGTLTYWSNTHYVGRMYARGIDGVGPFDVTQSISMEGALRPE